MARTKRKKKPAQSVNETAENHFRQAKIAASRTLSYYAPAIRALNPIFIKDEKKSPGRRMTMGVDRYYRVYVGEAFVLEQVQAARDVSPSNPCLTCSASEHHPLAYVGGVICHEASHLVRKHYKRYATHSFTNHYKWNVAADLELNDDLLVIFRDHDLPKLCLPVHGVWPKKWRDIPYHAKAWEINKHKVTWDKIEATKDKKKLQAFAETLSDTDLEQLYSFKEVEVHGTEIWPLFLDSKLAEEYYMLLPEKPPCPVHGPPCESCGIPHGEGEHGDQDGDDDENQANDGHGEAHCTCPWTVEHGSGVGGDPRDYEVGPPSGEHPGVSEAEGKLISREVAKNLCEAKKAGNMPAGMARWADAELEPAKYNWESELRKAIMVGAGRKHGNDLRSFRRLGILTGVNHGKILFPMKYDPVPDITVVQDTSGSMDQYALNASGSEIDGICKALGATIRITSVDAQASELTDLANVQDMRLTGGGGTDMRVGIEAALKDPQRMPSVIIVMSDGYTEWPDVPPNDGRTTLIVCLVGEDSADLDSVPGWALGVKIEGENPEVREAA